MIQAVNNSQALNVAMLTVCVDRDLTDKLLQPTAHMPWKVAPAESEEYMSPLRRTQFSIDVKNADAIIAVVDFDQDAELALETTAYLHQLFFGKIAVIALSSLADSELLLRAMRSGCNEFLKKPFDPIPFAKTLDRLEQQWSNNMGRARNTGQILSFFGAKGGVGTTTVAVQLATFLVRCHKKKVLLIDNHQELGHVCLYLGLDGNRYHFHELLRNVDRLDSDLLRGFIATHQSGLDVLSSPDSHDALRNIDPDAIERTLEFLRGEYDYVLLDCETSFAETNLAVMDRSDQIYLIATPEIGAIRDLSRYIDGLIQNEHTTVKVHVVINRFSSRDAVGIEQIEKAIRLPVEVRICNSYAECVRAINVGEPIGPERKSEFSLQFTKWSNMLVGANSTELAPPAKKRFALW
ncbi:AAA family ATPase [Edaphobacter paludis]|uniref:AAA family ATPase n=1 Tax=Edaphobacter paludis TaxID=3035702 RepID=A0AAU7DAY0_9BACT